MSIGEGLLACLQAREQVIERLELEQGRLDEVFQTLTRGESA